MKQIFTSQDSSQVGLVKSILENAGIACEIRNEALSQVIPGIPFLSELWVLNDEEFDEASEVMAAFHSRPES